MSSRSPWNIDQKWLLGLALLFAFYGCGGDPQAKKAAHMQRGKSYLAAGEYAPALIEFRNAVQLAPNDAQAHYQLGLAYLKTGKTADVLTAFRSIKKSVQLDAGLFEAQLKLGQLHLLGSQGDSGACTAK